MFKLLCPACGKYSYSSDENCFSGCPYCGIRFSGRYGFDKRHEERYKKEMTVVLDYQGEELEARSMDFSAEGIGIVISGEAALGVGDTVELSATAPHVKAKVKWMNRLADKSKVGLERIN